MKFAKFIKENILLLGLIAFSFVIILVNMRINYFRYNNFDYGKFDLGNMTQMLWTTMHGKFMYLTDYFGTDLPRWAMSHVDPILLLFLPGFMLWQHPLSLVFSQLVLILFSSVLVYKIAFLVLKSKLSAFFLGMSFLFYPAIGFLTAWTGFHGVSAAIPFFLGAFYVLEKMHLENDYSTKRLVLFWTLLVITMSGKEQLPLTICLYGLFIILFRNGYSHTLGSKFNLKEFSRLKPVRLGFSMMLVGFIWFFTAFFIIIPRNAHYRIEGYQRFVESLDINPDSTKDVDLPNYFLGRYDAFGDSYAEVLINAFLSPSMSVRVFFGGDKIENLRQTFGPLVYLPLAYPPLLLLSAPDFFANYMTTAGGIGTAEIFNHRISMIIPVLFVATIFAIKFINDFLGEILRLGEKPKKILAQVLPLLLLISCINTSFEYENPVYLWMTQAVKKRIAFHTAYAKTDSDIAHQELEIGAVVKLSDLENKDRECALKIINMIPEDASVTGPDYLGAHLSMRHTYGIFPALYDEADYVIVDVFAQKILRILDVDTQLLRQVVEKIIRNPEYELETGCGNLFVFKRIGLHDKDMLLPLQERFEYTEKVDLELFQALNVVDYNIPQQINRGELTRASITYVKRENKNLDAYVLFTTFVNEDTGDLYQAVNLPSFGIIQPREWMKGKYYTEHVDIVLPAFLDEGTYKVFVGMTNVIRTRSMYLGDVEVN